MLALDADFLTCGPGNLRYVADFMSRRRIRTTEEDAKKAAMNRLYVVEPTPTVTGSSADHRLPLRASSPRMGTLVLRFIGLLMLAVAVLALIWSR